MAQIVIDAARCSGHGRCYTLAPDAVDSDVEGFAAPRDVPIDVEHDQGRTLVDSCPERAIRMSG